ncbi:MAG TPA: hypothetical protein DDY50_10325 [Erwinia persicina]|nr:hypothetical protein [Erwinia persicina]
MLHGFCSQTFIFSIELPRNLAESRQRKKAPGHPVAFFRTFRGRTDNVSILISSQHPCFPLPLLNPVSIPDSLSRTPVHISFPARDRPDTP